MGTQSTDPQVNFFWSGKAHAYYAIAGCILIFIAIAFGGDARLAVIGAALAGGVFADIWAHGYQH